MKIDVRDAVEDDVGKPCEEVVDAGFRRRPLQYAVFKIDVDKRLLPLIDEFKPATWREAIK